MYCNNDKKYLRRLIEYLPHTVNVVSDGHVDSHVIVQQIDRIGFLRLAQS